MAAVIRGYFACHGSPAWKILSKLARPEAFLPGLEHNDPYEKLGAIPRFDRVAFFVGWLDERFGDQLRDRNAVDAHWL